MLFPASLRTIAQDAFSDCKSLATVTFGEGLKVLGTNETSKVTTYKGVFQGSGVQRVTLPHTLKRLGHSAFRNCTLLNNISLPSELEIIEAWCFANSGINKIVLPSKLKKVGNNVLRGCSNCKYISKEKGCTIDTK